jgi:hypothetical protein
MKISKPMVRYFLSYVTSGYFNHHDVHPDTVEGYQECVPNIQKLATKTGDLPWLRLAFEYLLAHPEIDTEPFAGLRYPYDDEEVRDILRFLWRNLWTDRQPRPADQLPPVELAEMDADSWAALRDSKAPPA